MKQRYIMSHELARQRAIVVGACFAWAYHAMGGGE